MRQTTLAGVFAVTLFALIGATVALATPGTPPPDFIQAQVAKGLFQPFVVKSETDGWELELQANALSDLYVVENTFAPGAHTGWHTHPGPSLITVKEGTITAYDADCNAVEYSAPAGFIDPGREHVHLLKNAGTVPAKTVAVQIVAAGSIRRIDVPTAPCTP